MKSKKPLTLKDLKPAKYNPRSITADKKKALDKSLYDQNGDLSGVVFNRRSGVLISGHQRTSTMQDKNARIVTKPFTDEYGTVEMGYIEVKNEKGTVRVPFRVVDWDSRQEKLANIAANSIGGEFDNQKLGKLLAELDTSGKFAIENVGFTRAEIERLVVKSNKSPSNAAYSRKLASPVYKPQGKKPKVSELVDLEKTNELKAAIHKTPGLKDDVKQFLLHAAERHAIFKYDNIAEFYAHAPKAVQRLMEDCALVIVDVDDAIENGYVKLSDQIKEMANEQQQKDSKKEKSEGGKDKAKSKKQKASKSGGTKSKGNKQRK